MRIVIELDTADGRATVTTEPHPQELASPSATPPGAPAAAEATDAGPPADGMPLTGQAPVARGEAVDAGPAPSTGGESTMASSEQGGGGQPIDAGGSPDLG